MTGQFEWGDGGELPSVSSSLLNQVQRMQPEAWSRLVAVFSPIIYGWARTAGMDSTDAIDIVQDVFIAVARNVNSFERKKTKASFRSWLATITRNKVRDRFRVLGKSVNADGGTEAMQKLGSVPASESSPRLSNLHSDVHLEQVVDHRQLESMLPAQIVKLVREQCDDRTWQAFWLTTAKEMPAADVAQELEMSVSSVYQAKSGIL